MLLHYHTYTMRAYFFFLAGVDAKYGFSFGTQSSRDRNNSRSGAASGIVITVDLNNGFLNGP